jgi:hypothetical protein
MIIMMIMLLVMLLIMIMIILTLLGDANATDKRNDNRNANVKVQYLSIRLELLGDHQIGLLFAYLQQRVGKPINTLTRVVRLQYTIKTGSSRRWTCIPRQQMHLVPPFFIKKTI